MNVIEFIGIAHAIFIIVFVISKEQRTISDNTLIIWMAFLALPLLARILSPQVLDIQVPIFSRSLAYPLCFGPFLWLYVECVTADNNRFRLKQLWHFLPFVIIVLYQLPFQKMTVYPEFDNSDALADYITGMICILSLLGYSGVVIWRLHKHNIEVRNSFSALPGKITLRWLVWLTYGFIFAYMFPLVTPISTVHTHGYAFTGFIFILSFFGLRQTQVFIGEKPQGSTVAVESNKQQSPLMVDSEPSLSPSSNNALAAETTKEKYQRSGLTQARATHYLKHLENYTQEQQPYLDANLTVYKLADQSRIPRHYLTQIFSEQLNKNFYTYINEYRVKQVKALMSAPQNSNMSLLDMAYESGFNSKSTFNSVFKKITGMTPSQFKKQRSTS